MDLHDDHHRGGRRGTRHARRQAELKRRERAYRDGRPLADLRGRVVVLVDDGLATGFPMKAAVEAVGARGPSRIVVAVPAGSPETCRGFAELAAEIVCARAPDRFAAAGQWYFDFSQTAMAPPSSPLCGSLLFRASLLEDPLRPLEFGTPSC